VNKDTISTFFSFIYTQGKKGREGRKKGGRSDLKSLNHHTSPQKKVKTQTTRKKQAMIGNLPSHHTKNKNPEKGERENHLCRSNNDPGSNTLVAGTETRG